jgi:tetratricopeptide (TPR) repeat protein
MPARHARDRQTEDRAPSRARALLQAAVTQALAALNGGDAEGAVRTIEARAELARDDALASCLFGLIHMQAGTVDAALAWFEQALRLEPAHAQALGAQGVALHRLGRTGDALRCYEKRVAIAPEDPEAAFMCAGLLQSLSRSAEALAMYDRALVHRPDYPEALINRGALRERSGQLHEALRDFDAARALRPEDATIDFNRGAVLQRLGRLDAALAAYEAARRGGPDPELACNRGNVLQKLGRPDAALLAYDEALGLRPAYPQAHYNRAIALHALGQPQAALDAYDAALALDPTYAEAHCNRGNLLHERGAFADALAAYDAALAAKPALVPAGIGRATVLLALGRTDEAIAACARLLEVEPRQARALCLKGAALYLQGRFADALAALDAALALEPTYPEALLNRGNALQDLGRLEESLDAYDLALACRPDYAEALSGRGVALKKRGEVEAARAAFDAALRLKPDFPDACNNRAGTHLVSGRLVEGFADYESRWQRSNAPAKILQSDAPDWRGTPRPGGRLVIFDEQGAGDLIQFARFLPIAAARSGADVTFLCRRAMRRLLAPAFPGVRFVERLAPNECFDAQAALMSLPHILGTTLDTIPAQVPYLAAEPDRVARWASAIGGHGYKIGVSAAGNMAIDPHRSIPLGHFAALAALPGVRLISLMKDRPRGNGPLDFALETLDLDTGPDAFLDTAALMTQLDLVVSCDTSIAHLAGALGRPAFVALKHTADWRWLLERDDSPWYPTLRLFRQPAPHDWAPVFADMTAAVAARMSARAAPLAVPTSVGELIDKITILEIKSENIVDAAKRANVDRELALLRGLKAERAYEGATLAGLETELKAVNAALWTIEDDLRRHEDRQDFGPDFVTLARQVYKTNDRRAALKRQINLLFDSAIVEEKSYAPYVCTA